MSGRIEPFATSGQGDELCLPFDTSDLEGHRVFHWWLSGIGDSESHSLHQLLVGWEESFFVSCEQHEAFVL